MDWQLRLITLYEFICDEYYYEVKIHVLGLRRPGTLPLPDDIGLMPASDHDLPVFRQIAQQLHGGERVKLTSMPPRSGYPQQFVGCASPSNRYLIGSARRPAFNVPRKCAPTAAY